MTEDRPKIADKIMFWQEQDRINQELIPRVLKQHELFSTHVENHDTSSAQIAALEALQSGDKAVEEMRQKYNQRRHLMING